MGEYQTPVGLNLRPPTSGKSYKCIVCAFTGTEQERYDHEVSCLTILQQQVKAIIKAEAEQRRQQLYAGRPQ